MANGADLTRFDFHAFRFIHSEDVRVMTDSEVGQYILLLCESWLAQKEASLPNDPGYLATIARCQKVSAKVLAKFDVVDTSWGTRLRNKVLYEEWIKTIERSESARKASAMRWQSDGNATTLDVAYPQTKPIQSESIQTNPNQENNSGQGDFKTMCIRYRSAFGVSPCKNTDARDQYTSACQKYGEPALLENFESWARENEWIKADRKRAAFGLKRYYDDLEEILAANQITDTQEAVHIADTEKKNRIAEVMEAEIAADLVKDEIRRKTEDDEAEWQEKMRDVI